MLVLMVKLVKLGGTSMLQTLSSGPKDLDQENTLSDLYDENTVSNH